MFTDVEALISTIGAVNSSSVSASMSNCPLTVDPIVSAESLNWNSLAPFNNKPVFRT